MNALAVWGDAILRWWLRRPIAVRASVPVGIMALLWWSSSVEPTTRTPNVFRALLHNGMHVVAYAALAGGWLLTLARSSWPSSPRAALLVSLVAAVAYGVVDEVHQSFVPGRVCSLADLMTDAAGATLALMVLHARLGASRNTRRALLAAVSACLACVALATFGPL